MNNMGQKFAAGGKIALGTVGIVVGAAEGIGRCLAGVASRRGDLILTGVTEGMHRAKAGWHVVEEGFDDWDNAR